MILWQRFTTVKRCSIEGLRCVPEIEKGAHHCLASLASHIVMLPANVFALGRRGTMGRCYRLGYRWLVCRFGGPWLSILASLRV